MVDIPERSVEANFAKSVFYTQYNDIDIYVEDTKQGYEKVFKILFSRLFEDKFRVDSIFPLGGRDKVINKLNVGNIIIYIPIPSLPILLASAIFITIANNLVIPPPIIRIIVDLINLFFIINYMF